MEFSQLIETLSAVGDEFALRVGEDWAQGRASFGGLVAAIGNEAMRSLVPRERPLRSLQTTFVGPAAAPGEWRVVPRLLRVGRAVSVAHCEVLCGADTAAVLVGVYGGARLSAVLVDASAPPPAPRDVDAIPDLPFELEGGAPAFIQHFAIRWSQAARPFSGQRSPTKAFIRHRDPARLTEAHVIALVDCIPTPALSMLKAPAPSSSLVWTLQFLAHEFDFASDRWWRLDTDIDAAADGYVHQHGVLMDPEGRPAALTRQLFTVFG